MAHVWFDSCVDRDSGAQIGRALLEAELAAIERQCAPFWRTWIGVAGGLVYARRLWASPPRVVRAMSASGLLEEILRDEEAHSTPWPESPAE